MHDIDLRSLHAKRPEKYYLENAAVSPTQADKGAHIISYAIESYSVAGKRREMAPYTFVFAQRRRNKCTATSVGPT